MTRYLGGRWRSVVRRVCQHRACARHFYARTDADGKFCSLRCIARHTLATNPRFGPAAALERRGIRWRPELVA